MPASGRAQEIALFGVAGRSRDEPNPIVGAGASVTGLVRLGSIFGPDAGRLQHSQRRLGIRASVNDLRYSTQPPSPVCEGDFADFCAIEKPPLERVRFQVYELVFFVLPVETTTTRVELGGGVAGADRTVALSGVLGVSRRIRSSPVWASAGWEPRKWFHAHMADASDPVRPAHSWRLGLSYRLPEPLR